MRWRSFLNYGIISLILAVTLAACGDNTATPSTASTTAASQATTAAVAATTAATATTAAATGATTAAATGATTAAAAASARPVTGGTFRFTMTGEPDSLDPKLATSQEAVIVMNEIFDGPTQLDKDLNVKPNLAESWTTSPDGKVYTFKIRQGVKFSNGDPVTAADFVYSWNRVIQNEKAEYDFVMSDIVGFDEVHKLTGDDRKKAALSGLKALNDFTLEVTLTQAASDFILKTALHPFFIVDKKVVEASGDKWIEAGNLVGTGAFLLKEWKHNQSLRLEFNPNYWEGRASIDAVTIELIKDGATARLKYDNGELDSIEVPVADLTKVKNDAKLKTQLQLVPRTRTNFIGFKHKGDSPFATNKELRKAFYQAIDRRLVAEGALQGAGLPLNTLLVPGLPSYKPYDAYPFDPAKAKASLVAAGYDTPAKVKQLEDLINNYGAAGKSGGFAYTPERAGWQQASESYVQQFKQHLGITLKLNPVPTAKEFFERRSTGHEFLIYFGSWGADYPDPNNFYQPMMGCETLAQQGGEYCNKDFDAAWKAGAVEKDTAKRAAFYQTAEKILQDDAGMIPTYSGLYAVLIKPTVSNWTYNPQGPTHFKDAQIKK
ncbi:MAG: extracellular solute-binding protein family 5 [Chloroflexi bacterium]|nr:extracellular solute-binding protein family 5 [Chloroflexota bacterium]